MKSPLQVMKFGGTSVGDASCISRAAQIIAAGARAGKCVAVVSAMSGVTNRLIEAAKLAQSGNARAALAILDELAAKHESTLAAVVKNEAERGKVSLRIQQVLTDGRRFCKAPLFSANSRRARWILFPASANASPLPWSPRP